MVLSTTQPGANERSETPATLPASVRTPVWRGGCHCGVAEWEPARSVSEGQDSNPDYHFLTANTTGAQVIEPSVAHTSLADPCRRLQAAPCLTSPVWYTKFSYLQFCGLSLHPNIPLLKTFLSPSLSLPPHSSLSPPLPLCPSLLRIDAIALCTRGKSSTFEWHPQPIPIHLQ